MKTRALRRSPAGHLHVLALATGVFVPAALLRFLALIRHGDWGAVVVDGPGWLLVFRGMVSDLVAAWLVGVALGWLLRPRRSTYVAWTLVWGLVFAGNAQHIRYNDAHLGFAHAGYLASPELVEGHLLVADVLLYGPVAAAAALLLLWWAQRRRRDRRSSWLLVLAPVLCAPVLLMPTSPLHAGWMQEGVVESQVKALLLRTESPASTSAAALPDEPHDALPDDLRARYLGQSLAGPLRFAPRAERPNVLLVLVESLAATYVRDDTMPFLARFGRENLSFTSFFSHRYLTINGLYALLAGDYPNLKYTDCKADILGTFGARHPLLPERLAERGYDTIFLQSAALGFMRKDLFAREAGFREIYGSAAFATAHGRGPWGVDDRTLFERALEEVRGREAPWMMTLLTSGTHPPYNVPLPFRTHDGEPAYEDALRYADESLAALVEGLDDLGVLDNTLVLVTSDEVKGEFRQGVEGAIDRFRSPLVVHVPEGYSDEVDEPYGHVDVTLSLLDYLGESAGGSTAESTDEPISTAVIGRSLFRRYDAPRSLLVGRNSDVMVVEGGDRVHFVTPSFDSASSYGLTPAGFRAEDSPPHLADELRQVVESSDLTFSEVRSEYVFRERDRTLEGRVPVVAQLSLSARRGDVFTWDVEVSTQDVARGNVEVRIAAGIPQGDDAYNFFFIDTFQVNPKSEIAFRRSFAMPFDTGRLDHFVDVTVPEGQRARLEHAHITLVRQ